MGQHEACEQYEIITKFENHSCKPILKYQFRSVGVEVCILIQLLESFI